MAVIDSQKKMKKKMCGSHCVIDYGVQCAHWTSIRSRAQHNIVLQTVQTSLSLRVLTADVGYVPNAKYLAHIPHQTPFDPIYQMF